MSKMKEFWWERDYRWWDLRRPMTKTDLAIGSILLPILIGGGLWLWFQFMPVPMFLR